MDQTEGPSFSAKLKTKDRPFLDAERFRLVRQKLVEENRFKHVGFGQLVSILLEELRELRRASFECECGASEGIVDPDATIEDPAKQPASSSD